MIMKDEELENVSGGTSDTVITSVDEIAAWDLLDKLECCGNPNANIFCPVCGMNRFNAKDIAVCIHLGHNPVIK